MSDVMVVGRWPCRDGDGWTSGLKKEEREEERKRLVKDEYKGTETTKEVKTN